MYKIVILMIIQKEMATFIFPVLFTLTISINCKVINFPSFFHLRLIFFVTFLFHPCLVWKISVLKHIIITTSLRFLLGKIIIVFDSGPTSQMSWNITTIVQLLLENGVICPFLSPRLTVFQQQNTRYYNSIQIIKNKKLEISKLSCFFFIYFFI